MSAPTTNERRSEQAYNLVLIYQQRHDPNVEIETAIIDLMADLLHLATEYSTARHVMESALEQFYAEITEHDDHGLGCDGPLNCVCGHTS